PLSVSVTSHGRVLSWRLLFRPVLRPRPHKNYCRLCWLYHPRRSRLKSRFDRGSFRTYVSDGGANHPFITDKIFHAAQPSASPRSTGRKDRKSTRLNSSHSQISYAVFCLKKK